MGSIIIDEVISKSEAYIANCHYLSYDPFDALTNKVINFTTKASPLLRRIANQVNSKSPIDIHWLGMVKMVHTKTISDLLWFNAIRDNSPEKEEKVNSFFNWLLSIRNENGYGWGLNFPYTSRFINASEQMPNLYNTVNSGIAICYAFEHLNQKNSQKAKEVIRGIIDFMDSNLGYVDEGDRGWYLYYPGQKYPTYNVNALALYFLTFVKSLNLEEAKVDESKLTSLVNLLCGEQQENGSWFYSRSAKGNWVDGFHTGFILESLAFALKEGIKSKSLEESLKKGWGFFVEKMFTEEGFPKYFLESNKYPIEAQNCAQAIQTLANFRNWLNWNEDELLEKVIRQTMFNLYSDRGFFYHKKTKYFTYKMSYIRWSITPMMLALTYAKSIKVE